MKVFISADIEGAATTTIWEETFNMSQPGIAGPHCRQMTLEVKAACEGAIAASAEEIVVKDAHGYANNLDVNLLPECVRVIRGWSGHPYAMVEGVDSTFDAAMFIGYHSPAGSKDSPLSHTCNGKANRMTLNGMVCSEFLLYSWACARKGVPAVLLAGDSGLCRQSEAYFPGLTTVAVKDGLGGATCSLNPQLACKRIREAAERALAPGFSRAACPLPDHFTLEVRYKEQKDAVRASFYPGCVLADDLTVRLESADYFEILRGVKFIL